jgi:hypothetical protein
MTPPNRPRSWIASLIKRKASTPPALVSNAVGGSGFEFESFSQKLEYESFIPIMTRHER